MPGSSFACFEAHLINSRFAPRCLNGSPVLVIHCSCARAWGPRLCKPNLVHDVCLIREWSWDTLCPCSLGLQLLAPDCMCLHLVRGCVQCFVENAPSCFERRAHVVWWAVYVSASPCDHFILVSRRFNETQVYRVKTFGMTHCWGCVLLCHTRCLFTTFD